jgi:hypothetical protein
MQFRYAESGKEKGVASRDPLCSVLKTSVLGADLDGLHAGLGLGAGLEHAVVHNGRGRACWPLVNDGALLGGRVAYHIEFGGLRERGGDGEGGESDGDQKLVHGRGSSVKKVMRGETTPIAESSRSRNSGEFNFCGAVG